MKVAEFSPDVAGSWDHALVRVFRHIPVSRDELKISRYRLRDQHKVEVRILVKTSPLLNL